MTPRECVCDAVRSLYGLFFGCLRDEREQRVAMGARISEIRPPCEKFASLHVPRVGAARPCPSAQLQPYMCVSVRESV